MMFTGNSQNRGSTDSHSEDISTFIQNRGAYDLCVTFDNDASRYRYYKTINGCITNDYYDIWYNGEDIDLVIKSRYNLLNQKVYPINHTGYEWDNSDSTIIDCRKTVMYYLTNDSAIPVEITYITKQFDKKTALEVKCVNLYSGEAFDYSKLSR